MSRRKQHKRDARSQARRDSRGTSPLRVGVDELLVVVATALLVWRLLVPTESAPAGETLWITQNWLFLAAAWVWVGLRSRAWSFRVDWIDGAVLLLAGWQVVSALSVLATEGDKRAALNMLWEWLALGLSFVLVRRLFRERRRELLVVLAAVMVTLAGYGIWQHYVQFPGRMADFTTLQKLESRPSTALSLEKQRTLGDLRREFATLPQEEPERTLLIKRMESTEPYGTFALANSFAGLLVVWCLMLTGFGIAVWRNNRSAMPRAAALLAILIVVVCLVLTKSRTAYVALACGLVGVGVLQPGFSKRRALWAGGIALGACLLVALLFLTGGLDREVLSEAPKSLRYRMEYWTATWDVIKEHPFLGAGPGNFRQAYLAHKLETSSESIADPHNLFLDVWANAGLPALVGLLGVLAAAGAAVRRHNDEIVSDTAKMWPVAVGCAAGFCLPLAGQFLVYGSLAITMLWLGVGTLAALWCLSRAFAGCTVASSLLGVAVVGLAVHLLGAGGIAMPGVFQTGLVLLAVASPLPPPRTHQARSAYFVGFAGLAVLSVLAVACLASSTLPVMRRSILVDAARVADRPSLSEARYLEALKADPLSDEPPRALAQLAYLEWSQRPDEATLFEEAVSRGRVALERNPHNWGHLQFLGECYLARARRIGSQSDAATAAGYYKRAVARNATVPALHAEFALALAQAGKPQEASQAADEALRLERLNRRLGHVVRYIPEPLVPQIERLASDSRETTGRPKSD